MRKFLTVALKRRNYGRLAVSRSFFLAHVVFLLRGAPRAATMILMPHALDAALAALDSAISVQDRIIDTYEGMISHCNNGDGADGLFARLDQHRATKARLEAEWNRLLVAAERGELPRGLAAAGPATERRG